MKQKRSERRIFPSFNPFLFHQNPIDIEEDMAILKKIQYSSKNTPCRFLLPFGACCKTMIFSPTVSNGCNAFGAVIQSTSANCDGNCAKTNNTCTSCFWAKPPLDKNFMSCKSSGSQERPMSPAVYEEKSLSTILHWNKVIRNVLPIAFPTHCEPPWPTPRRYPRRPCH